MLVHARVGWAEFKRLCALMVLAWALSSARLLGLVWKYGTVEKQHVNAIQVDLLPPLVEPPRVLVALCPVVPDWL